MKLSTKTTIVGLTLPVALCLGIGTASASWYGATTGANGANLRTCTNTGCAQRGYVPANKGIRIVCQTTGQSVTGSYGTSNIWDYVVWEGGSGRPEGFAADANIYTGHSGFVPGVERCR